MTDFGHPIETLRISPGRLDLEVVAGDTLSFVLEFTDPDDVPIDIGVDVYYGSVRRSPDSPVVATLDCRYVTDGSDGLLRVTSVSDIDEWGSYRYDIEANDGWNVRRTVLAGSLFVHRQTTH